VSQTAAIARSSRIYWVFISGSRVSGFGGKAFFKPLMDTYGASSMEEAMPCGLGFSSEGSCGTGWTLSSAHGLREIGPASELAMPLFGSTCPHQRIRPSNLLLSQTAAIARGSRIYWVFISGSRASGIFVAKYFFRNGKKFRLFYAAIILPLPL